MGALMQEYGLKELAMTTETLTDDKEEMPRMGEGENKVFIY